MDLDQPGTGGLTGHFQDGHNGNPYRVASTNGSSMSDSSNMPSQFTPQSVLQAQQPSKNGMSDVDYSRHLLGGSVLPTQNGSDKTSYDAAKYMNFIGEFAR